MGETAASDTTHVRGVRSAAESLASFVLGAIAGAGLATISWLAIGDRFGLLVVATIFLVAGAVMVVADGRHRAFGWGALAVFVVPVAMLVWLSVLGIGMSY